MDTIKQVFEGNITPCTKCGSTEFVETWTDAFGEIELRDVECKKCGEIYYSMYEIKISKALENPKLKLLTMSCLLDEKMSETLEVILQWIPVRERLPEDHQEVLISVNGEIFICRYEEHCCRYDKDGKVHEHRTFVIKYNGAGFVEGDLFPTHWMQLPELPATDE